MRIYVLTGSIATGKTTIGKMFLGYGIPVFDADEAVHELYEQEHMIKRMQLLCPQAVVDGKIDRNILGKEIFWDNILRRSVEHMVHYEVREMEIAFLHKAQREGAQLAILDIPLYYETGAPIQYGPYKIDKVLVMHAPQEEQMRRAMDRAAMSNCKFKRIKHMQLADDFKERSADMIIDNSGDLAQTNKQVMQIIRDAGVLIGTA